MMKKTMNRMMTLVLLVACMGLLAACSDAKREKLKEEIEKANKECPINLGGIASIESITYDEEGAMKFAVKYNEQLVNVGALKNVPEIIKENVLSSLIQAGNAQMLSTLVACDAPLKIEMNGENEKVDIVATTNEISQALSVKRTPEEQNRHLLENTIKITKVQLPMEIGPLTLTDFKKEGSFVAYVYTYDDSTTSLASLVGTPSEMHDAIVENLKQMDPALKQSLLPIANCNLGLVYRYVGSKSGKTIETRIAANELQDALGLSEDAKK